MDKSTESVKDDNDGQRAGDEQKLLAASQDGEDGINPKVQHNGKVEQDANVGKAESEHNLKCATASVHEKGQLVEKRSEDDERMDDVIDDGWNESFQFHGVDQISVQVEQAPEHGGHGLATKNNYFSQKRFQKTFLKTHKTVRNGDSVMQSVAQGSNAIGIGHCDQNAENGDDELSIKVPRSQVLGMTGDLSFRPVGRNGTCAPEKVNGISECQGEDGVGQCMANSTATKLNRGVGLFARFANGHLGCAKLVDEMNIEKKKIRFSKD